MLSENEIIVKICQGETHLFRTIVGNYQQKVAALCYKVAGRSLDIEEISQQVFIELYKSLKSFRFQSQFGTFVYRVTLNTVCKQLRDKKRNQFVSNEKIQEPEYEETDHDELQLKEKRLDKLQAAIKELKQNQQTALCLHVFEDVSYKEIAATMNTSVSAVESLIFRAKENLKKKLYTEGAN